MRTSRTGAAFGPIISIMRSAALAGRLGEIAGRRALVIDGEDIGLSVWKQHRPLRGIGRRAKAAKRPTSALQDVAAAIGAGGEQADRHPGVAGGEARMESMSEAPVRGHWSRPDEVLAAMAIAEAICSRSRPNRKAPPAAAPISATQAGRAEQRRERAVDQQALEAAADFIGDDGGLDQPLARQPPRLGEREQQRPDDDAVMADGGRLHVLAHKPVALDGIDEGGVGRRRRHRSRR